MDTMQRYLHRYSWVCRVYFVDSPEQSDKTEDETIGQVVPVIFGESYGSTVHRTYCCCYRLSPVVVDCCCCVAFICTSYVPSSKYMCTYVSKGSPQRMGWVCMERPRRSDLCTKTMQRSPWFC